MYRNQLRPATISAMRITAISGGVGGARYLRGLRDHLRSSTDPARRTAEITVIGNTGDDITLYGMKICPDLDTILYTLGGGIEETQGWGRAHESFAVQTELAACGVQPQWMLLGDRDFGTHIARSHLLGQGRTLSEATETLASRWGLPEQGIRLLPMTDDLVETHVQVVEPEGGTRRIHFQEWWIRHQASIPAEQFIAVGVADSQPAPGVLAAIAQADIILLPPSNPVVSIGIVLAVPGVRAALRATPAPVVGVSPLVGGRPVRGHLDACLHTIGQPCTSAAVAGLYEDFLTGWLIDEHDPAEAHWPATVRVQRRPLLMTDPTTTAALAGASLDFALSLRRG